MERPFQAYKGDDPYVFVCYAHDDAALVYPEMTRLREGGFNIWYDEGIAPGSTWRDEVALALTQCKVFLYFVTPRSVASSNCLKELNFCLSRERQVLAVHLENTVLPPGLELSLSDMQAIIRKDHSHQAYCNKLVQALESLLPNTTTPFRPSTEQPDAHQKTSIAILPLVNRSTDPDNEYLCDGIAEELIGGLASLKGLKVASQLSSFVFKNQNVDLAAMGARMRVDHVLSGSVQKVGNRVRIHFLLSRVGDGTSLWSKRYDRELQDIFELQEDVARQVVDALRVELAADQPEQLLDVGTQNARAYEAFLLGLHAARRGTLRSLNQAIGHLQQATKSDPSYGRAYWWLYFCYWRLIGVGRSRKEVEGKALDALDKAKAAGFAPPVPWIKARRDLLPETRPDQRTLALEACEKIRQPDPEWRLFEYIQLGECLIAAGFNHAACDYYEHYLDGAHHDLSATWIQWRYLSLLSQLGRFDKAITLMKELGLREWATLYSRTGQYEKAESLLAGSAKASRFDFGWFYHLYWRRDAETARAYYLDHECDAIVPLERYWTCFLLGNIEAGIDHLEEDIGRGAHPAVFRSNIGEVLPRSLLQKVESNPRYQTILKRFGIDDQWCEDLQSIANKLTPITGIRVQPDQDY